MDHVDALQRTVPEKVLDSLRAGAIFENDQSDVTEAGVVYPTEVTLKVRPGYLRVGRSIIPGCQRRDSAGEKKRDGEYGPDRLAS